ncbi:MAG: YceD family protein [Pseudomonadota bacterium]
MSENLEIPSFERKVDVADVSGDAVSVVLSLAETDAPALAQFLEVPAVGMLRGEADLLKHGALITVQGRIEASLTRECVATLEQLTELVDEHFIVTYSIDAPVADFPDEVEADLDMPEPIEGGVLEMRDVFLEQLVLAMDPHPRKEGAEAIADPGAGATISPFSVLADLKQK